MDLSPKEIKLVEDHRSHLARQAREAATPAGLRRKTRIDAFLKKHDIDTTKPDWFGKVIEALDHR